MPYSWDHLRRALGTRPSGENGDFMCSPAISCAGRLKCAKPIAAGIHLSSYRPLNQAVQIDSSTIRDFVHFAVAILRLMTRVQPQWLRVASTPRPPPKLVAMYQRAPVHPFGVPQARTRRARPLGHTRSAATPLPNIKSDRATRHKFPSRRCYRPPSRAPALKAMPTKTSSASRFVLRRRRVAILSDFA
jgi:hypothetical protein